MRGALGRHVALSRFLPVAAGLLMSVSLTGCSEAQPSQAVAGSEDPSPSPATPSSPPPAPSLRLLLDFEQSETLSDGDAVDDTSGLGQRGTVRSSNGGELTSAPGSIASRAVQYPAPCGEPPCPKALVEVPDSPLLVAKDMPLTFSAVILMEPGQTTRGSNILQQGLWDAPDGQWKLQVDGLEGKPSCTISGFRGQEYLREIVTSTVSVADGLWHTVECQRGDGMIRILVDGVVRKQKPMPAVALRGMAPVLVGAKDYTVEDNDQFHGRIDEVRVEIG
jgi:hypothetical protein